MTLEDSLRGDLDLVAAALGLVERIPDKFVEPQRDVLSRDWPKFGPEAQLYQDFLMGNPAEGRPGAWDRLSSILSSFRIEEARSGLDLIHSSLVHPAGWLNTDGHSNSRRRLIVLLEDVADHLRRRLKRECGPRKKRAGLTLWADLNVTQQRIMRALAVHREPRKGALLAKELDIPEGTAKPYLAALVKAGFLRRKPEGYAFEKLPDGAPEIEGPKQPHEPEQPPSNP